MKQAMLGGITIILLAGCANAYTQQATSEVSQKSTREMNAWAVAMGQAKDKCGKGKDPDEFKPSEAIKLTNCITKLINKEVLPVAIQPELVIKDRASALRDAEAYSQGKISRAEWSARAADRWANYLAALDNRARAYIGQAQQADQARGQNIQRALDKMSDHQNQMEIERLRANQQNRPVNTTCNTVAGNLNCTTW